MESARTVYRKLREVTPETAVAVATIIEVRGSVPREVGAKMMVHPLGQHYGTIGGGCGEGEVIKAGLTVIETGRAEIVEVDLTEDVTMQSLGVCGGIMRVFVERWPSDGTVAAGQIA